MYIKFIYRLYIMCPAAQVVSIIIFVNVHFSDIRNDLTLNLAWENIPDLLFSFKSLCNVWQFNGMQKCRKADRRSQVLPLSRLHSFYLSFFLSHLLPSSFFPSSLSLNNIPVSGLQLDHRDAGSPLASGVAVKKDKEQMVVFVIPSSFQPPGKPHHLSPSLCTTASLRESE